MGPAGRAAPYRGRRPPDAPGLALSASLAASLAAGQRGSPDPLASTALSVALLRLPLPQRQVTVLYYLADLPVEEIARDCEVSASTVRTRLAAARHRLERELKETDQEVPDAR